MYLIVLKIFFSHILNLYPWYTIWHIIRFSQATSLYSYLKAIIVSQKKPGTGSLDFWITEYHIQKL